MLKRHGFQKLCLFVLLFAMSEDIVPLTQKNIQQN